MLVLYVILLIIWNCHSTSDITKHYSDRRKQILEFPLKISEIVLVIKISYKVACFIKRNWTYTFAGLIIVSFNDFNHVIIVSFNVSTAGECFYGSIFVFIAWQQTFSGQGGHSQNTWRCFYQISPLPPPLWQCVTASITPYHKICDSESTQKNTHKTQI
jgi:hypothetical protein